MARDGRRAHRRTEGEVMTDQQRVALLRHMLKRMRQSIMLWGSMCSMREGRDLGWRDDLAEIDRVLKETAGEADVDPDITP